MVFFYNRFYIFTGLNENQFFFFLEKKNLCADFYFIYLFIFGYLTFKC